MNPKDLKEALDRIVEGEQAEGDHAVLLQAAKEAFSGDPAANVALTMQFFKYNISIGEGRQIRIGDCRALPSLDDSAISEMMRALPPLNRFKALIDEKTQGFVGREYIFAAVKSFINNNIKGYFTIIGDPGQGKSAILAKLVQDTQCVAHFNLQLQGINRADQFLESVCRQLVIRYDLSYDPLPPRAIQNGEFLYQLLEESVDKTDRHRLVIAVDALDEVDPLSFREANILYLPPQLPDGVYFILTRRQGVEVPLTAYAPAESLSLQEERYDADSNSDVRTYIQNRIDVSETLRRQIVQRRKSVSAFIDKLTNKSEKNFMYLQYVLQDIESGKYADLALERFPSGLQGYYEFHWRRMGMMSQPLPIEKIKIVYILAEIRQPVSVRKICDFSSEEGYKVEEVVREWMQFLHALQKDGLIRYSVYHSSFRDFLHRRDILACHPITLKDVHRRIAEDQMSFWGRFKAMRTSHE